MSPEVTVSLEFVAAVASFQAASASGRLENEGVAELQKLYLAVEHSSASSLASSSVAQALQERHPEVSPDSFSEGVLRFLVQKALQRPIRMKQICSIVKKLLEAPGWQDVLDADSSILAGVTSCKAPQLCEAFGLVEEPGKLVTMKSSLRRSTWQDIDNELLAAFAEEFEEEDWLASQTFCWMYGDLWRVASLNPVRWSRHMCCDELLAQLEALTDKARPVRIQGKEGQQRHFGSAIEALDKFRPDM